MSSQSFFDRVTSSRRGSLLPIHSPPQRLPSEYDLDELDPRPDDRLLSYSPPRDRFQSPVLGKGPRSISPGPSEEAVSSIGSNSKLKFRSPHAMFTGPPPPIAASLLLGNSQRDRKQRAEPGNTRTVQTNNGVRVLFDHQDEHGQLRPDSAWRSLQRQERAIETDVQHLLDLQASGLIAGLDGRPPNSSDFDDHSDAGSSTPTGTFYSTATSRSRMMNSLHIPTRANADGNVIPVRQPKRARPPGLREARTGLRKSMLALANLKAEEDAHIDDALSQRKKALAQLDRLGSRRDDVSRELQSLEHNEEEPLGQALRDLGSQYDSLTHDIRALEEKLVGMRNRRRVVRAQMEDVQNQREAGLSGFRGALRDVESDVTAMMRRPPIQPLDPDIFKRAVSTADEEDDDLDISGGVNFLRMIPERRTIEMARSWWQAEITALERRKVQIDSEHRALEEGGVLWLEAMALVTDFESRLRSATKGASTGQSLSPAQSIEQGKGKEKELSQQDIIRGQLPLLDKSIVELEGHMQTAETNGWNLLICAIGAELEAFREAREMLREIVGDDKEESTQSSDQSAMEQEPGPHSQDDTHAEDSDGNEVPDDLLVSGINHEESQEKTSQEDEADDTGKRSALHRVDSSDNDVPADFFAEHDKLD
ncbi:hypothetical protein CC79DRAFT_1325734 [Sarocladium strictum]